MTKDEIMALAKETGLAIWHTGLKRWQLENGVADFAKLVAEREREQCALICDAEWGTSDEQAAGVMFSKEIRKRGEA